MRVSQLTNEINLQKWSALIEECRSSGMQVKQWCKEKNIEKSMYYYWQKKICKSISDNLPVISKTNISKKSSTFTEIQIPETTKTNDIALTITINNISVQIHNNASEETIAAALRIIKEL